MGLDVYTYTREQGEQNAAYNARVQAWEERCEKEGIEYGDTEKSKERYRQLYKEFMDGLEYVHVTHGVLSRKHPDSINNRRYLRSSYNEGGYNSAVPMITGDPEATYYGIFKDVEEVVGPFDGDTWKLTGDHLHLLEKAKLKAESILHQLGGSDRLVTTEIHLPAAEAGLHESPEAVLAWAREREAKRVKQITENPDSEHPNWGYSSQEGHYFGPEGLPVLYAGFSRSQFSFLGPITMTLVYRRGDKGFEHYVESTEVLIEFIEELIDLIKADGAAYVSWSG